MRRNVTVGNTCLPASPNIGERSSPGTTPLWGASVTQHRTTPGITSHPSHNSGEHPSPHTTRLRGNTSHPTTHPASEHQSSITTNLGSTSLPASHHPGERQSPITTPLWGTPVTQHPTNLGNTSLTTPPLWGNTSHPAPQEPQLSACLPALDHSPMALGTITYQNTTTNPPSPCCANHTPPRSWSALGPFLQTPPRS